MTGPDSSTDADPRRSPAEFWRDILRSGMSQAPDDDAAWHRQLLAWCPEAVGLERFVVAAALLTFGHLEAATDILDDLPAHPASARMLAGVLNAVLPMDADPYQDPDGVRQWLAAHRDRLVWVDAAGRFELVEY
ncbi:MAG TPA: hypothetical protein VES03_04525 [Motilibacterales bacterium]|nr:hypothetical protein [Motilibacterales bacterium]